MDHNQQCIVGEELMFYLKNSGCPCHLPPLSPIAAHGGAQGQWGHSDKSLAHIQVIGPVIRPLLCRLNKSTDGTGGEGRVSDPTPKIQQTRPV